MNILRALTSIATVSLVACGGGASAAPDGSGAAGRGAGGTGAILSEAQIEQLAGTYPTFQKITAKPFRSDQHAGNPMVNVYANATAADTYRSLTPAAASAHFAPGSMLVKEILDPAGGPPLLTAAYKMPPGYDAAAQDWWRGRLNADGSATAPNLVGKVDFCIACHAGAAGTDAAFGAP